MSSESLFHCDVNESFLLLFFLFQRAHPSLTKENGPGRKRVIVGVKYSRGRKGEGGVEEPGREGRRESPLPESIDSQRGGGEGGRRRQCCCSVLPLVSC